MAPQQTILNYKQLGSGEHVVLIHGLFGNLDNLNMVAKPLSEKYCVTSIDVRNHGHSFHQNNMDYNELAQDIINVLDHLSIENCILLGHSMGGKIAIQTALTQPTRIKKLIVADIAPVDYPPHHAEIINGLKSIDLSKVTTRRDADKQLAATVDNVGIRQFLLKNLALNEDNKLSFTCCLDFISQCYSQIMKANDLPEGASPYGGPTLFIKGGDSDYILPKYKEAIAQLLPNSKAKVIQGVGHWLHAEKPTAFNKIVTNFISDV